MSSGVLQLFPGAGGTGSAWFKTPVSTGPFGLSFTVFSLPSAAGMTVGFQNQGLTALGGGGGTFWAVATCGPYGDHRDTGLSRI